MQTKLYDTYRVVYDDGCSKKTVDVLKIRFIWLYSIEGEEDAIKECNNDEEDDCYKLS